MVALELALVIRELDGILCHSLGLYFTVAHS